MLFLKLFGNVPLCSDGLGSNAVLFTFGWLLIFRTIWKEIFFFFSKNDCILSWNLAVPQNISSYSVYYYTVPWSFCNCSVMLCFWVMFGVECDVLAGFKIATQLSVLPGHKMYSKQHLNLMRMREICDKSIYRALSENLFILKIY